MRIAKPQFLSYDAAMQKGLINKRSYSELALLAIFAAGLFFANLVVKVRSQIRLGQGYELIGSGVSVHWPAEQGWQGLTQWQLEQKNCIVLPARSTRPVVEVQWTYGLSTTAASSEALLEQLGKELEGTIADKAISSGSLPMQIGRLINNKAGRDCYLGAAVLDFGRTLVLRVQSEDDLFYANDVFTALVESIEYHKPEALAAGIDLLENVRRYNVEKVFAGEEKQNLLIVDAAGSVRGYECTQIKQESDTKLHIDKTIVINTAAVRRKDYTFDSNDSFREFHWQNRFSNSAGQGSVFQLYLKDEQLTIQDPTAQVQTFLASPVTVCDILLDNLARFFIDNPEQTVVLDILGSEGQIILSQLHSISPSQALGAPRETAHVIRVESLGSTTTELYFDVNKKLLRKITTTNRRGGLIWTPVTQQEIDKYFDVRPALKGPVANANRL
jgi:hypothetical protein